MGDTPESQAALESRPCSRPTCGHMECELNSQGETRGQTGCGDEETR